MLSALLADERAERARRREESEHDDGNACRRLAPLDSDETVVDAVAEATMNRFEAMSLDRCVLASSAGANRAFGSAPLRRFASARDLHAAGGGRVARTSETLDGVELGPDTALLLVDVQPVYWSEAPEIVDAFPEFPGRVKALLEAARFAGSPVTHVRASYAYDSCPWLTTFERMNPGRKKYEIDPTQTEPFAEPVPGERVFHKSTFDAFYGSSELSSELRAAGVRTVVVCGLITSVCVQHCVFGAFNAGFRVAVAQDACADRTRSRHEAALELYGNYVYELTSSKDIVRRMRRSLLEEKTLTPPSSIGALSAFGASPRASPRDPLSMVKATERFRVETRPSDERDFRVGAESPPSRLGKHAIRASPSSALAFSQ